MALAENRMTTRLAEASTVAGKHNNAKISETVYLADLARILSLLCH